MLTVSKNIHKLVGKGFISEKEKMAVGRLVIEIKSEWEEAKIKIFGSKVQGTADEESDVDLLILLPCDVTEKIRRQIIHQIFTINLTFDTNISALILSKKEWRNGAVSVLPIHTFIEEEGVPL